MGKLSKKNINRIKNSKFIKDGEKDILIDRGKRGGNVDSNGVYCYLYPESGYIYVGQVCSKNGLRTIAKREQEHLEYLENKEKCKGEPSKLFRHNVHQKHKDEYIHIVLENIEDIDGCNKAEEFYINALRSFNDNNKKGLNFKEGGDNKQLSKESRKKMSEAKDSIACYSLDLTTLCKMKYESMNEAARSLRKNGYKKASQGTIHNAIYGIDGRSSAYNKLWSLKDFNELTMEEIQALVAKHFKRIEAIEKARIEALSEKVIAEHPTTGEKLIFNSIMEAERLGVGNGRKVNKSNVTACCKRNHEELNGLEIKHKRKSCAGYRWYYVDDFKKYFRKEWEEFIKNIK